MASDPVATKRWAMSMGADCKACPLKLCIPVPPYGNMPATRNHFVVVGESPGFVERQEGRPFIGPSGDLLRQVISGVGGDPDAVYYTNIVMCHPPGNDTPIGAVLCCLPRLEKELEPLIEADVLIVAAGRMASDRLTNVDGAERGAIHHTERFGRVMHVLHPAAILHTGVGFQGLASCIAKAVHGAPPVPEIEYWVADAQDTALAILNGAASATEICIDLETELANWREYDILCMGIATSPTKAYIIPKWLLAQPPVQEGIRKLFDSNVGIVGQNIMFDLVYLNKHYGIENVRADHDTMIAHYVLDENSPHGLKEQLLSRYDMEDYEAKLVKQYRRTSKTLYSAIPQDALYEYCAKDVCYNLLLWDDLQGELIAGGLYERPYQYPIMASHDTLLRMELRGLPVAANRLGPLDADMEILQRKLTGEAQALVGRPFNPNSPKQVAEVMYDVLKLPMVQVRGKKPRTTCEAARVLIMGLISPTSDGARFLTLLDEIRSVSKLRGSYVKNVWDWLVDGRVNPHYKLTGTVTGRLSAADPAIQTIPRTGTGEAGGERWGKAIKNVYVADDGTEGEEMVYVLADYSQAELRIAACLSMDEFLLTAYREGRDVHGESASVMFGPDYTKEQRGFGKNYNFALLYGGTEYSFVVESGMDVEEARALVGKMTERMSGFVEYRDAITAEMQLNGYVTYRTGRRRRWPFITNDNYSDMAKAAINSPIQGSASDLNLMAMIEMDKWVNGRRDALPHTNLALTVHDSIGVRTPMKHARLVAKKLRSVMVRVASEWFPEVPWKVDVEWGPSWGELEEMQL